MRPNSIKLFEMCFILFFLLDTISNVMQMARHYGSWVETAGSNSANDRAFFYLFGGFIASLVFLVPALYVSRRKSKISFWITTILSAIFIFGGVVIIFDSISSDSFFSYDNIALIIMVGFVAVGLIFLYQKDSRDWLRY